MPGSTLNAWPGSSASVLPATMYGSSCASVPMPCPTRCTKESPKPARAMTARDAASTSRHSAADGRGAHARLLRLDEHRVHVGDLRGRLADVEHASDVGAVARHGAAEVAQHEVAVGDRARPPWARGAGWRRWRPRRRSRSSYARARPRASVRPARDGRRARSGPRTRPSASPGRPRRRRAPRASSASISSASFTIRIGDTTSAARENTHEGTCRWRSSTNRAQVWSPIATRRAERLIIDATIAIGSSVSSHVTIPNSSGRRSTRGASSRGTTSWMSPVRGSTSIVRRSSGMAS